MNVLDKQGKFEAKIKMAMVTTSVPGLLSRLSKNRKGARMKQHGNEVATIKRFRNVVKIYVPGTFLERSGNVKCMTFHKRSRNVIK